MQLKCLQMLREDMWPNWVIAEQMSKQRWPKVLPITHGRLTSFPHCPGPSRLAYPRISFPRLPYLKGATPRLGSLCPNKFLSDTTPFPLKIRTCQLGLPPQTHSNPSSKTELAQHPTSMSLLVLSTLPPHSLPSPLFRED